MKLAWLIFAAAIASGNYPEEAQKFIDTPNPIICEVERPRKVKVGVKIYSQDSKAWFVRIFTKDGEELEIWLNYDENKFLAYYRPDKVFYRVGNGWLDKDRVKKDLADELDQRLKFTKQESSRLDACYKKKSKK